MQLLGAIQTSASGSDLAEGFTVAPAIPGKGKGLVATRDFQKSEEVLRERAFAALQSLDNRKHVLACANCFRFVGAPDGGLRLQRVVREGSRLSMPRAPYSYNEVCCLLA